MITLLIKYIMLWTLKSRKLWRLIKLRYRLYPLLRLIWCISWRVWEGRLLMCLLAVSIVLRGHLSPKKVVPIVMSFLLREWGYQKYSRYQESIQLKPIPIIYYKLKKTWASKQQGTASSTKSHRQWESMVST